MLVRKIGLGEFWTAMLKKYGHGMLDQNQVVKVKNEGKMTNDEIAGTQNI